MIAAQLAPGVAAHIALETEYKQLQKARVAMFRAIKAAFPVGCVVLVYPDLEKMHFRAVVTGYGGIIDPTLLYGINLLTSVRRTFTIENGVVMLNQAEGGAA